MATRTICGGLMAALAAATTSGFAASPGARTSSAQIPPEARMIGVNIACGEFGGEPSTYGRTYIYPGEKDYSYWAGKGITVVRLPFRWHRLQKEQMAELDPTEMSRIDKSISLARKHGMRLLMDMHNYATYRGKQIGTEHVPNDAFADAWRRLAEHWKDEPTIIAYGLMNEPHQNNGLWKPAAQAAVDAIRTVDMETALFICGDGWSGAHSWKKINRDFIINDPAGKVVYEAHQYFDHDHSGTYRKDYDKEGATPECGVKRLKPFADWLKQHNAQGFIGEFGVPDDDPRWLEVLDNFTRAMKEHGIGGTYWAAGPWWGGYSLSVQPKGETDRPQTAVLLKHAVPLPTRPVAPEAADPEPVIVMREPRRVPIEGAELEYDRMLQERVRDHLAAGHDARVYLSALRQGARVTAIDDSGSLQLNARGTALDISWSRLTLRDRYSLARGVARDSYRTDHCIVAFFALAACDEQAAREALASCGDLSEAVEGFFSYE